MSSRKSCIPSSVSVEAQPPTPMRISLLHLLPGALFLGLTQPASAAAIAAAPPPTPRPAADEIVELSPFTVDASKDKGYRAENTLAGSRLNASLRDTPASVTVFTEEFLQDIGLNEIEQLIDYSVGSQLNLQDINASPNANALINGQNLLRKIDIRGVESSQGLDFFKSITPNDSYRVGRYDESRGPNGILFGIGSAGGLINQSSLLASTHRDSGRVSYQLGNDDVSRVEFNFNKVIVPQKLALTVAAVDQENGGWRQPGFQDKARLYATLTANLTARITLRVMAERGNEYRAIVTPFTASDNVLAWLDNREARGVGAVTFVPPSTAPTAAMQALGITSRNGAPGATVRRYVAIANDGTVFNSAGAMLTGSYNNPAVRAPDGTPGVSGDTMRLNLPGFLPYDVNSGGPGMFRDQNLANYSATLDWRITDRLSLNLAHNYQVTDLINPHVAGSNPAIAGEANRTLGVNGPANPYAGRLYLDAPWQNDTHRATYRESRVGLSYDLDPKWTWLGSHRLAAAYSFSKDTDRRNSLRLGFAGAPFNADPLNNNNLLTQRAYLDESNPAGFVAPDWRKLPQSLTIDGRAYDLVWLDGAAGTGNAFATQESAARLVVAQSRFWNRRLVTTLGYRVDDADVVSYGYGTDPVRRTATIDFDEAKAEKNSFRGITRTQGLVLHATSWLSLLANHSTNIGVPTFTNSVLPNGKVPDPPKGEGEDYGLAFDLLDRRLSLKAVYFKTAALGDTGSGGINARYNLPNIRIAEAFEGVLVGPGRRYTAAEWAPIRQSITTTVNAQMSDMEADGYEFSAVANPTPNWRFMVNYSYTDRVRTNSGARDVVPWYGFTANGKLVQEGVTQNPNGSFSVDPAAFATGGTVARWIELSNQSPAAAMSTLLTSTGITIAEELRTMIRALNDGRLENDQRWGLRPHKVSLFSAYDVTEGRLRGASAGLGYRWRSANIIGLNASGGEIMGRTLSAFDLMLRYRHKVDAGRLKASLTYQVNVSNLLNRDGIMPQRFSALPAYNVPGGRGIAYSRFDFIDPRSIRLTTTLSF